MSKSCVIYCRTSTLKQNISTQEWQCKEFAEEKGLIVKGIFKDNGISGQSTHKRNALFEAINLLEHGDIFLIRSSDRLSRDMNDAKELERVIKSKGCTIISVTEDISSIVLPNIDGSTKPCYIYLTSDNDTDIMLQVDRCKEYAKENQYHILAIHIDHDTDDYNLLERPILSQCINKLKKGDMIITYALKFVTTRELELSALAKILSKKDSSMSFIIEGASLKGSGFVLLSSLLMIVREQLRPLDEDHILNMYLPIICARYLHTHPIEDKPEEEVTPDEDNGYLYIFPKGLQRIGSGKSMIDIYNLYSRDLGLKTSIYLYSCKDPDILRSRLIAWLIYKQYVDHEDRDDTLVEGVDIQDVLYKMKELTERDPLITTMGDIQKQNNTK